MAKFPAILAPQYDPSLEEVEENTLSDAAKRGWANLKNALSQSQGLPSSGQELGQRAGILNPVRAITNVAIPAAGIVRNALPGEQVSSVAEAMMATPEDVFQQPDIQGIPQRVLQQSQDLGKRLSGQDTGYPVDIHAVPQEQGVVTNQYGVRSSFGTPGFAPLTDAQARQRLVKNLGLKDESQLTYDAYGNISNVAEGYKRQLAEMRAEKDAEIARRRQARLDQKLAAAAEKDPRLALSLMLQQAQQAQAGSQAQAAAQQKAFENAIAQQELGLSQRAENRLGRKAELDEAKALEESNPLSKKNISNALMGILGQVDWAQVPLQGEEGVKAVANIAMQLYAQANNGLYDPIENKILTPEDIKKFADKKTGGNYQEAYELLRAKVMAVPEEKKG